MSDLEDVWRDLGDVWLAIERHGREQQEMRRTAGLLQDAVAKLARRIDYLETAVAELLQDAVAERGVSS